MRGVQSLTAQQGTNLTRLADLGLLKDRQLVLGRESAPARLLPHFLVIRRGRRGGQHPAGPPNSIKPKNKTRSDSRNLPRPLFVLSMKGKTMMLPVKTPFLSDAV